MARPDSRRDYSMEVVDRAEELWCVDGLSYDAISLRLGVGTTTLKRWAQKYGWGQKRDDIRQARTSIRANTILLRSKLLANCLKTLKAMDVFAAARMEEVAIRASELAEKRGDITPVSATREITTEAEAVAALEDAIELRLNAMLASPDTATLAALREAKSALDLLRDMRAAAGARAKDGPDKERGVSAETAERIRALLGGQA